MEPFFTLTAFFNLVNSRKGYGKPGLDFLSMVRPDLLARYCRWQGRDQVVAHHLVGSDVVMRRWRTGSEMVD